MKTSMTVLRRNRTGAVFVEHVGLVVEDIVEVLDSDEVLDVVEVVVVVEVDEVVVSKFSVIQSI